MSTLVQVPPMLREASEASAPVPIPVGVVLGCPRSGTTFLMSALQSLPATACLTGIAYPISLPHLLGRGGLSDEVRDTLISTLPVSIAQYLQSGLFNARATALQKWRAERSGLTGLARALRGEHEADRLIFKEPFLSFAPESVLEGLPAAPLVYLVRDGRDCANSLVRSYDVLTDERLTTLNHSEMRVGRKVDHRYVPWWVEEGREDDFLAATPYVRAIWMWKAMVERCASAFEAPLAADRVFTLRYESFMEEPLRWGEHVAAHFGAVSSRAFRQRLSGAHTSSIGKFRRRDAEEIAAAERVAGEALAHLGYH